MSGIRKTFGPVVALDGVDFTVADREIHGLLGGNGAGKTTLMNVLYGLYAPDAGTVEIDGAPVSISSPKDAITAGIGMVHQNFLQVDVFTVTENIVLGTDSSQLTAADGSTQTPAQRITELSERFGLTVDPSARVADLPVGVRQRVEILKALYRGAKILVLDEPTTNLTPQEVDDLFSSMRAIVDDGMSVVLITHKIRETMEVCDRMTVMRDGRWIATVNKADTSADDLASTMIGEVAGGDAEAAALAQAAQVALGEDELGEASLEGLPEGAAADVTSSPARVTVRGLTVAGPGAKPLVDDVSLSLRPGEILGIAGVAGNGQGELAEALTGIRSATGSLTVEDLELVGRPTATWLRSGVVYVPEDRQRDGILPGAGITENLVLGSHRTRAKAGLINWRTARAEAVEAIKEFSVKTPSAATPCGQLSGGNIQRVILARAFAHNPKLLLLHNPTRGLDLRSTQFVYDRVRRAASEGCVVIVISEDLDEVLALSDRITVAYSGQLVGDFARGEANPYDLGRLMTGVGA
ncbi:RbsA [Janibacter sp. HTCC2649]|uniref:ABC transporter ATP-binding protein n=1 Tax=Janibacter sp. HTCC2649 TaxID=313589 RepID=UPI000067182B|nr:ABC transporter ATP-binding protein [Janibacter sp. HTCC2649]EAP97785.1 RbsA [Janibacter sp. HTCC2649]